MARYGADVTADPATFLGYRRGNGSVATRNHVVILPVDDLSNAAVERVARVIEGTLAIPHPYGRLQFGDDLELHFRTLIGTGANPNVAAAIVIGIEPNWTKVVVEGIARTGKPVAGFAIEEHGDIETVARAAKVARAFAQDASEAQREPIPVADAVFSIKCGESDTTSGLASNPALGVVVDWLVDHGATVLFGETSEITGAEHIIAGRMATPELREAYLRVHDAYQRFIRDTGFDLLGSQPTQGNIAGGLSTIEEKALGNIQKTGTKPISGVQAPAEAPKGKGLHFMDTSSAAAEAVTLWAAGGSVFHFFTTGQGNVVGNPIIPVLKLSANPKTVRTMGEHIDVDLSGLLTRELTLAEAGERIEAMMWRVASGRLAAAEVLGHREFVLTKLYRSA
jgi:(2R)-sulfolactate sulfo-lyase subunit beta